MSEENKTIKDLATFIFQLRDKDGKDLNKSDEMVSVKDVVEAAKLRCDFIKKIFLSEEMDKSPPRTQREAYFHQLGKFEELSRFADLKLIESKGGQESENARN